MNNLLPLALIYLTRGWSVIPVGSDKKPISYWKEYQSRLATPEELTTWWTKNPDAQIGIVTGKISNLTVIDVEADGDFSLVKGETYTVETGGKGRHYYFQYEAEFKNAVRIFPNVDVRSEGGYVVAAGSSTIKGAYTALNECQVVQMPPETKTMFLGATRRRLEASTAEVTFPRTNTDGLEYLGYGEGLRNEMMTKYAGSIHAKLHPSLWPSLGWQMFSEANKKNDPPLPARELQIIWMSIGSREQRQNPGGRVYSGGTKVWGPDGSESKQEESHFDGEDPKDTLHVSEVAELQKVDSDTTYPLDMPPFDEALLGGFSAGELIVVAGQPGHGKTTLVQDWSVTLASGGQSGKPPLPSLWFSYEVLAKPLWDKFRGMGATTNTPIYMPRFNETGETEWVVDVIERAIAKWKIKMVAIDHLGFLRAPRGNYANQADAVTHTVRSLKRLAVKHGLIVTMPVHVRKTTSALPDLNDIRDSLGIAQEADTVFFIGRERDKGGMPTAQARVSLLKNRKSGISVSAILDFQFGRYFYNANNQRPITATKGRTKTYDDGQTAQVAAPAPAVAPTSDGGVIKMFDDF